MNRQMSFKTLVSLTIFLVMGITAWSAPPTMLSSVSSPSKLSSALAGPTLNEDFLGSAVNSNLWGFPPVWTDACYLGRTRLKTADQYALPTLAKGNVIIDLNTYQKASSPVSLLGTDLISKQLFTRGNGLIITIRAKLDTMIKGTVAGFFLYIYDPVTDLHDEIDFELLGNRTDVQTNIYASEPFGAGHPQFVEYPAGGKVTDYHIYQIRWLLDRVEWYIDGILVRTEKVYVPIHPMNIHLNMWAPAVEWAEAYDASLQPTNVKANAQTYKTSVDSVKVELSTIPTPILVVEFKTQPNGLTTNYQNYWICGNYPQADLVMVNGTTVAQTLGGISYPVVLNKGSNSFTVVAKQGNVVLETATKTVKYDPEYDTSFMNLMYVRALPSLGCLVINLDDHYLLGYDETITISRSTPTVIDPSGRYQLSTAYSSANGRLYIRTLSSGKLKEIGNLWDYMGQIAFSGKYALVGAFGNSYYGGGGIYTVDLDTQEIVSTFNQFGADSVLVSPNGRIFATSYCADHFGNGSLIRGTRDRRGVDEYILSGSTLMYQRTYFLNAIGGYSTGPDMIFRPAAKRTAIPSSVWTMY